MTIGEHARLIVAHTRTHTNGWRPPWARAVRIPLGERSIPKEAAQTGLVAAEKGNKRGGAEIYSAHEHELEQVYGRFPFPPATDP